MKYKKPKKKSPKRPTAQGSLKNLIKVLTLVVVTIKAIALFYNK